MSLADLSAQIRAALKWLLVIPVLIFLIWLVWLGVSTVTKGVFKPKGAETAYGNLAPQLFTKTFSSLKAEQFELATSLPKSSDKADVFQTQSPGELSDKQQKEIVNFFSLTYGEKNKEDSLLTWKSNLITLSIERSQSYFSYRYDFSKDASVLNSNLGLDKNQAIGKAKEILKKVTSLPKDIDGYNVQVRFFTLSTSKQVEAPSTSANAVEVGFFRKIGNIRSSGEPLIRLLISGGGSKILELDYNYYPLNPEASAYPIINSSRAWEDVQTGKAFTTENNEFDVVKVTGVHLSYWESKFHEPYLQPIWVFSVKGETKGSEKEFEAYLPAIKPSFFWGEGSSPSPP